jgi:hypothetical protein
MELKPLDPSILAIRINTQIDMMELLKKRMTMDLLEVKREMIERISNQEKIQMSYITQLETKIETQNITLEKNSILIKELTSTLNLVRTQMITTQKEMKNLSKTAALEPNVKECLEPQLPHLNPQARQTVPKERKETKENEEEVITGLGRDYGLQWTIPTDLDLVISDLDRGWEFPMNSKKWK